MRIFVLLALCLFSACAEKLTEPTIREEVVLDLAKAIKAHESRPALTKFGLEKGAVVSYLFDYRMTNIWCEYEELTQGERQEVFERRLKNFPKLRAEVSKLVGREIETQGLGLYLGGERWKRIPHDQKSLAIYREYLSQFGTKPCWEK